LSIDARVPVASVGVCQCGQCDDCWLMSLVTTAVSDDESSASAWRVLTRSTGVPLVPAGPAPSHVRLVHPAPGEGLDVAAAMTTPQRLRALCELVELIDYEKARAVITASNEGMRAADIGTLLGADVAYVEGVLARADGSPRPAHARAEVESEASVSTGRHRLELVTSEASDPVEEPTTYDVTPWDGLEQLTHVDRYDEPAITQPSVSEDAVASHRRAAGKHRAPSVFIDAVASLF
jgi:hypothetical protein